MPKQTTLHFSHHDPERPSGYSLREISTLSKSSLVMTGKNIKKSRNVISDFLCQFAVFLRGVR